MSSRPDSASPHSTAAVDSAQNTLGHFRSSDQLGVWTFTTGGVYKTDGTYQVRAVKPLGGDLENLLRELKNLVPLRGTPLYDAVRKGHATMTKRAEPGRINAIILLSDGDDAGSRLSQAALIAGLTAFGVAPELATAAVITHRLFTTYLPPIWGAPAMGWLRRRDYV